MKNNKAFTLVELLAVIVILAIILAIAIPGISGIVDSAKANAFKSDAKMLIKAIDYKKLSDNTLDPTTIDLAYVEGTLKQSIANYDSLTVTVDGNNKVNVSITGKNKWEGLTADGSYQTMEVAAVEPDTNYYLYNEGQYAALWELGNSFVASGGTTTFTKEASDIYMAIVNPDMDSAKVIATTISKVDLTSYTKLRYEIDPSLFTVYINSVKVNGFDSSVMNGSSFSTDGEGDYWDISSYNGEYYILCELATDQIASISGKIYKVWLE